VHFSQLVTNGNLVKIMKMMPNILFATQMKESPVLLKIEPFFNTYLGYFMKV